MNHIGSGQEWDLDLEGGGLEYLTPYAINHNASYRGKLEALNSAMTFLEIAKEDYIVLADSGVLCSIDFKELVESHIASGADVTVCVKEGICNGVKQLDMAVKTDENNCVTDIAVDYCAETEYLASMGIFVISRKMLIEKVTKAVAHNHYRFERDLVMCGFAEEGLKVNAYRFGGVALFNESTAEYFHNNFALMDAKVRANLFNKPNRTVYTKVRNEIPTYYGTESEIDDCIVADGCVLEGKVGHSVLFRGVKVGKDAMVKDSILMSDVSIGEGAELEYVILDKNVSVSAGVKLRGTYKHPLVLKRGEVV